MAGVVCRDRVVEFNPPAVMMVRLVFLLLVMSILGALLLVLTGAMAHDMRRITLGVLGAAGGGGLYGRLADVFESINLIGGSDLPEQDFTHLVHAWHDLRVKRGTADFDAWELLRLRREIEAKAKDDPRLADYWRDHQA